MSKTDKLKTIVTTLLIIVVLIIAAFIGYCLYNFFSTSWPDFLYPKVGQPVQSVQSNNVNPVATSSSSTVAINSQLPTARITETTTSERPISSSSQLTEPVASATVPVVDFSPEVDVLPASLTPQNSSLCGNGSIDKGEECDGNNLNNSSCSSRGFSSGSLRCAGDCHFDLSECSSVCSPGRCANQYGDNTAYNICYQDKCCKKIKLLLWDYYACKQ
ncbi:MAG: hypothetical protein WC516_00090 [Patescibacteria group bacterium]